MQVRNGIFSHGFSIQQSENEPQAKPEPKVVEPGEFIKSARSYGIEYEINFDWSDAQELRNAIGQTYNIVHDGSVRHGLEIVSPVLYGKAGEKDIDRVCAEATRRGATADETTGLHVHYGAKDFFTKIRTEVWPLSSAIKYAQEHPNSRNQYFVLHDTIIKRLKVDNPSALGSILANNPIGFFTWEKVRSTITNAQKYSIIFSGGIAIPNFSFCIDTEFTRKGLFNRLKYRGGIGRMDQMKEVIEHRGKPVYCNEFGYFVIDPEESKKLHVIVNRPGKNDHTQTDRLKRLAAFYVVFDDVIASMLPGDRRENDYTRRTNHRMSLEEIRDCSTSSQFLMSWLRFSREEQVSEARPDARPRGRYCGINLYALIKQCTIEVRYLGGTLDPMRVKHWIALHHAIIDLAASISESRGSVDALDRASLIVDQGRKTNLFFKKLRLAPETESYWRGEIASHQDDDETILRECVEADMNSGSGVTENILDAALDQLVDDINPYLT